MRYFAKITSLPNASTGELKLTIPTLTGSQIRSAYPIKPFLGLYEPYRIGDIVVVEDIEGRIYYGDKPYANGEYNMGVPKNSYSFVTPFGYVAFTPSNVIIKHINGGQLVVGANSYVADQVDVTTVDGVATSTESFLKVIGGSSMSSPTKWR